MLSQIAGPQLQSVILGHLSASNNDPALAVDTCAPALDGLDDVHLMAAARRVPGELFSFTARPAPPPPKPLPKQGLLFRGEQKATASRRRGGRRRRDEGVEEPERQLNLF